MITKNYSFNVKSVDETGRFSGYASVFGVVDTDFEVVDKGAFKRSIGLTSGKVPILWGHSVNDPVGWGISAREDEHGLFVEGQLMLNTEKGRLAYEYSRLGSSISAPVGLSVGFQATKDGVYTKDGQRHYSQVKWMEYSFAVFQACPDATVGSVKEAVLPAIVIKSDSLKHEDVDLTDEQRASLESLSNIIKSEGTFNPMSQSTAAAARKDNTTSSDPMSYEQAMASHQAMENLDDERSRIERAKHSSVNSIRNHATMTKADKCMAIHKSLHDYADALTGWHKKSMDLEDINEVNTKAVKGMDTTEHMKLQRKLGAAKMHLAEQKALHVVANEHGEKAQGLVADVATRYVLTGLETPNPEPKDKEGKADESGDLVQKDFNALDLSVLFKGLSFE